VSHGLKDGKELQRIRENPAKFLALLDDPEAKGDPVILPDGSVVRRLPGFRRWLWDGAFCGSIGFRWQPGTPELPPHVLGHIGYAVVPWKRGRGYASRGLALLLAEIGPIGLPFVDLITDPQNIASQAVISPMAGSWSNGSGSRKPTAPRKRCAFASRWDPTRRHDDIDARGAPQRSCRAKNASSPHNSFGSHGHDRVASG
jgi:predicted acetyltransferase